MSVKKGDNVIILGGKDRGKSGKILHVFLKRERVIVEGLNLVKKHSRVRSAQGPGGISDQAAPIHVSNVMLICPNCNKPARVGKRRLEDERKVRVCKRCSEIID
ncbi:MAG: 50S ribosomal protein L24 [bacterium]